MPDATTFQKIISGEIPSHRIYEDTHVLAFLDTRPLSKGHTLLIPKEPAVKLEELSEESAAAIGRVLPRLCRAIVDATGIRDYNILQNNGIKAHQAVTHVHFHIIPKPNLSEGLKIEWPAQNLEPETGETLAQAIGSRMLTKAA